MLQKLQSLFKSKPEQSPEAKELADLRVRVSYLIKNNERLGTENLNLRGNISKADKRLHAFLLKHPELRAEFYNKQPADIV